MSLSSSFPVFGETAIQDGSQLVSKIEVYDAPASNPFLSIVKARHCFMILTVKGRKKLVEAGDDNGTFRISYSNRSLEETYKKDVRKIVQLTLDFPLEIGIIAKFFNESFQGKKYDVIEFNCYHVAIYLFQLLEEGQLEEEIAKRYRQQVVKGTMNAAKGAATFSPFIPFLSMAIVAIIPVFFKTLLSERRRKQKGKK